MNSIQNIQYDGVDHNLPISHELPELRTWNEAAGSGMAFGGNEADVQATQPGIMARIADFAAKVAS